MQENKNKKIEKEVSNSLTEIGKRVNAKITEIVDNYIYRLLNEHNIKTRKPRYIKQWIKRKKLALQIEEPYYSIEIIDCNVDITIYYDRIKVIKIE